MDYLDIIKKAKLAEYGPVHGSIVILPYGVQIWKRIVSELSSVLEKKDHEQIYFPLFIPESFFDREREYLPDLSPCNFTVTRVGENKLNETLVVRPTSELTASYMFAKWVNSFRDLPIKVFQWANIARYEKVTHPFIKGTEIQWLEGHTVHSSHESAIEEIDTITDVFYLFITDYLKIPILFGEETVTKKFVGSLFTRSFETITPNGKALQLAAIYDLGQLFANQFSVKYRDKDNTVKNCWTTDWGLGFRLIGALALIHGDSRGLRLPSTIAPYQAYIVALTTKKPSQDKTVYKCNEIKRLLDNNQIRCKIIEQGESHFSKIIQDAEIAGVPITMLIGDEEMKNNTVTLLRRDKRVGQNRFSINVQNLIEFIRSTLNEYDSVLYIEAYSTFNSNQVICDTTKDLDDCIENNWVIAPWCGSSECEANAIESKRNIRIIIKDDEFIKLKSKCIICGKKAVYKAFFAHNY